MRKFRLRIGLVLTVLTASIGCGRVEGPQTAVVSGNVTLDGTPVADGAISFVPIDGKGAPSGAKIANGTYTADVPLGEKRVEIRAPKVVGQKDAYQGDPNSPKIDLIEERIPARYNAQSELRTNVYATNPPSDFVMETPAK